ncbi:UDP-glucose 4-epimerase GalE [Stutzerimonas kunmingensis]|uniref:UDP-glucose 4-epimerase GalE n=1 Tax=Stutzerimonas kunmingensis TaxID=1211807 RepID=UPI0028A26C7F|nr:UDP-glucose 4-epimerase GalE [Stutzerimonas kunmingensis]
MKTALVTGGAGYIGSHMVLVLLESGYEVIALDNLSNGNVEALHRVERIAGRKILFVAGDVRDGVMLSELFSKHSVDVVFHFAGFKSVGESVLSPLSCYENNFQGSLTLLKTMLAAGVFHFIFSSSATVYGNPGELPCSENSTVSRALNPYGRSKLMVEELLHDVAAADSRWKIALLRYFNPIGAHESGAIGEAPLGIPNNLVPYLAQVALGKREFLSVFGGDYPTPDGTCIRDYIHVMDLVAGHLCALQATAASPGVKLWNLGTGRGYSVLEMVEAFSKVSGCPIPYRFVERRPGDVAMSFANPTKAKGIGWTARRGIMEMLGDVWRWQKNNPDGYHG